MGLKHEEIEVTMENPSRRRNPQFAGRVRTAVLCAALVLTSAAAVMPAAVQTVELAELAWKLEAGTELVYRELQQVETELPQGMGTATMMRSGGTQRWSVLEVDGDGNATVRVTSEQVHMDFDWPMGSTSVDPADQAAGALLDAVAGTSFTVVFDPRGAVVEMSGLEELREALRAELRDLPVPALLDSMLGDEALGSQWAQESLGMPLPAGPVGVGSTWDSDVTSPIPGFGSMTVTTSYRVESIDGDVVVIGSSGTLTLPDGVADSSLGTVQFGDMTIVESSRFDTSRGLLLGTESTMRVEMTIAIVDQEMVTAMVTTTTLELIEDGD